MPLSVSGGWYQRIIMSAAGEIEAVPKAVIEQLPPIVAVNERENELHLSQIRRKKQRKLVRVLLLLLYFGGLTLFALCPQYPLLAQNVYVDENALLVNSATLGISTDSLKVLQAFDTQISAQKERDQMTKWVQNSFLQLGLETHRFQHCAALSSTSSSNPDCVSVVTGVLRGMRSPGKEAMLLVVEFSVPTVSSSTDAGVSSGLSIVLSLLTHLKSVNWLAKDFIVVAVENTRITGQEARSKRLSIEAFNEWLHIYTQLSSSSTASSHHSGFLRAGNIQAALVLDIPQGEPYSGLTLLCDGAHGLEPNLDVVSVILKVFTHHQVPMTTQDAFPPSSVLSAFNIDLAGKWHEHKGFARHFLLNLFGWSRGYHSLLIDSNIDALSLQAVLDPSIYRRSPHVGFHITLSLESTLRSFNNLIEKLHHSHFFYFLTSPVHFVTMGKYIYGFLAFWASLPVLAFYILFNQFHFAASFSHYQNKVARLSQEGSTLASILCLFLIFSSFALEFLLLTYLPSASLSLLGSLFVAIASVFFISYKQAMSTLFINWRLVKALNCLFVAVFIAPLGFLNCALAVTSLSVMLPLLATAAPFSFNYSTSAPMSVRQKAAGSVFTLLRLVIVVLFSPVSLLMVGHVLSSPSFLACRSPLALLATLVSSSSLDVVTATFSPYLLPMLICLYLPTFVTCCCVLLAGASSTSAVGVQTKQHAN